MIRHALIAIATTALFLGCDQGQAEYTDRMNIAIRSGTSVSAPATTTAAPVAYRDDRQDKNVVFVMDGSGSMAGDAILEAKRSMAAIVQTIDQKSKSSGEVWNVSLVAFDSGGISERVGLKPVNKQHLLAAIADVNVGSSTPLGSAMRIANNTVKARFKQQNGFGSYTIIVVTDGAADEGRETEMMKDQAADMANNGYNLQVIGYNIRGGHALKSFATAYREAGDTDELTEALSQALAEFTPDDSGTVHEAVNYPQGYIKPTKPGA